MDNNHVTCASQADRCVKVIGVIGVTVSVMSTAVVTSLAGGAVL